MNRILAAAALLTASLVSTVPAHAQPVSTLSQQPCTKTVAASWMGRGYVKVKEAGTSGRTHTIHAGSSWRGCPGWVSVPSGRDGKAWTGRSSVGGPNGKFWTKTGYRAFTSKQKAVGTGTLWVEIR